MTTATATTDAPIRIYAACLAAYNAGRLHGAWIDVTGDADELQSGIDAMLNCSPEPGAEEWAIHDYEAPGFDIEEYESVTDLAHLADLHEEHGDAFAAAYRMYGNVSDAESALDRYVGAFDGWLDMAEQYADEGLLGEIPEQLVRYFDYDAFARDLEHEHDGVRIGEMLHVFSW